MILNNAKIVLEDRIIESGYLIIKNNFIVEIGDELYREEANDILDLNGKLVLPGFIDSHVHGGYGVDFEQGDKNRFSQFAKNVLQEGVTSYVQGTITNSIEDNLRYFKEFKTFKEEQAKTIDEATCLGIYMEGPFISKLKKGAHQEDLIIKPDLTLISELVEASGNNLKIVIFAGENSDDYLFVKHLKQANIIPAIGHSNISNDEFNEFYKGQVHRMTHLFNGMSPITHQQPGLTLSGLINQDILVEVISDGIHLNNDILKLIYQTKDLSRICIITDAMNAKGLADGEYRLGNLPVIKKGMKVVLKDTGNLAAAVATYDHNIRNFVKATNISMIDLIKLTSINVAKEMKIYDTTGSIALNKQADLVILDKELCVIKTILKGKIVYEKIKD